MFSDRPEPEETTARPAGTITADDLRFEPLEPGVAFRTAPGTCMFTGCARTSPWNTPDSGITLEKALRFTGLDPEFWNVTHTTAYMWDDPAQGGSVIAYEFQLAEADTDMPVTR